MTMTDPRPLAVVAADDRGAGARRRRRKIVSYGILVAFAIFYIGPILMLVGASFKTLPEFFRDPTGWPSRINR